MNQHKLVTKIVPHGNEVSCEICECRETDLPTECPGYALSVGVKTRIYAGKLDFINDKWTPIP